MYCRNRTCSPVFRKSFASIDLTSKSQKINSTIKETKLMSYFPSDAQLMAGALCPKFTAVASVLGSSLIIRDVIQIRNNKSDALTTRHRLLVGMSVCDILSSSASFMTSWPVPEDFLFTVWNVGTTQTCSAQGFFYSIGYWDGALQRMFGTVLLAGRSIWVEG